MKNLILLFALAAGIVIAAYALKPQTEASKIHKYCDECECSCGPEGCICVCGDDCKCSNCGCPGCTNG